MSFTHAGNTVDFLTTLVFSASITSAGFFFLSFIFLKIKYDIKPPLTDPELQGDMLRLDLDGLVVGRGRALACAPGSGAWAAPGSGPLELPVLDHLEDVVGIDDVLSGAAGPRGALGREVGLLVTPGQRGSVHADIFLSFKSGEKTWKNVLAAHVARWK